MFAEKSLFKRPDLLSRAFHDGQHRLAYNGVNTVTFVMMSPTDHGKKQSQTDRLAFAEPFLRPALVNKKRLDSMLVRESETVSKQARNV